MNLSKPLTSIAVMVILILSSLSVLATPAHAVTTQTVNISAQVNCGANDGRTCSAQWFTYDSANGVAWISVGVCSNGCYGALYKVTLSTVILSPATSITGFVNPLATSHAPYGSLADGPASGVMLNGYLWVSSWYSVNAISVGQIDSTGTVVNQYYYSGPTDARAIATDGTNLFVGTSSGILKMTSGGAFSSLATTAGDVTSVTVSGSTVYFTESGSHGAGQVGTDGSGFQEYSCSCLGGTFGALQGGSFWVTDNQDHTLLKFTSGTLSNTYATGLTGDGPYGLTYDSTNNGFWLSGFGSNKIRFFSLASVAIDGTKDVSTTKKPFMGFVDSLSNVWNMALGSTDLIKISAPETTTSTTTSQTTSTSSSSTTSSTTTTTTSTATTDSSGCVVGSKCAGAWTPIVIPTIHISSVGGVCQITANGTVCSPNTTISGFEFFLSGPSSGDFVQWVALVGCCAYELSSLNPSNGTFAMMSVTARPYNTNNYPSTQAPSPVLNVTLAPTSTTQFGWFCNNDHITQYVWQCDGSANPVSYRTFSFTVPTHTIVSIKATGTESGGQVFVYNIFT